jgi:large subunit ribosomal protein L23
MALFGDKKSAKSAVLKKETAPKNTAQPAAASMKDLYSESAAGAKTKAVKSTDKGVKPTTVVDNILVKPLITEKAANLNALNKYAFVVSVQANKITVAKAIQAIYGVKPLKVNLINVSGKKVARGKVRGQRSDWRKAIVTLPKGTTIKIYEGV